MQQDVVVGTGATLTESRVKFSWKRHVLPPLLGVGMMLAIFGFSNSQFIAAKISALTYKEPAAQITQPSKPAEAPAQSAPAASTQLAITQANVNAPVIYGLQTNDEDVFQENLQHGVVHYPGTALPGQNGNTVIFGHSSGQVWAPGDYKFVFAHLENLKEGDRIQLDHKGTRYIYRVKGKEVVPPTDVSALSPTRHSRLTLITCTPVGTDLNRLIVTAEQISPSLRSQPTDKTPAPTEIKTLPSNQDSSFWESLTALF